MNFEERYFEQLTSQIGLLRGEIGALNKKVDDIQSKVIYMYGFAAAMGLLLSLVIEWIRSNFFK